MATVTTNYAHRTPASASRLDHVITTLTWTYGLVPIAAGADKFAHILTDWDKYLAPVVANILPFTGHTFMTIVGIIEILAGILVMARPKLGSMIVGLWLMAIAINLVLGGQYYDIAVRDIVMAIGAFCLYALLPERKNT